MLKKTISYEDYNGEKRVEDFYFNLTKTEALEMELSVSGGLTTKIIKIINTKDTPSLIKLFKDIILKSYGIKSDDGRRFIKTDKDGRPCYLDFMQTEAYNKLFMELVTDAKAGAAFINGIVPKDISDEIANQGGVEVVAQKFLNDRNGLANDGENITKISG